MKGHFLIKTIFFGILAGINTGSCFAQQGRGTVTGSITSAEGKPAAHISVSIEHTTMGTTTDENGLYIIRNIRPGTYQVQVSAIGVLTLQKEAIVKEDSLTRLDFSLSETRDQMQEVVVSAGYNKFARKEVEDVARLPLKNLENPQVYNVIPVELLKDQSIISYNDVLKNVAGVSQALVNGSNSFNLRGFFTTSYLRNGLQDYKTNSIDVAGLERIEVLKGPSGTLFGSSLISFGGLLNRVSKQPFETFKGELLYMTGAYDLNRVSLDINTPLNKEKGLYLRTNAAYHAEGSFMDAGFTRRFFVAPSLLYKVNDRLSVLVDVEAYAQKANDFNRLFPENSFVKTSPKDLKIDWKRSYSNNDMVEEKPSFSVFGKVDYKISDQWKSVTSFSQTDATEQGYWAYNEIVGDSVVSRNPGYENNKIGNFQFQQNFNGDFKLGKLRNRIVIGLDYYTTTIRQNNASIYGFDQVYLYKPDPRYNDLTITALDAALSKIPYSKNQNTQNTYSTYISDVLNITPALMAMVSARLDHFVNKGTWDINADTTTGAYHQTAISPKLGLVYQVIPDKVSLFGNYMNGFSNNAPVKQPDGSLSTFKPSYGNQWEVGVKSNLLNNKLNFTASYYHIKVNDMIRPDFTAGRTGFSVQDGGQLSKGIEVEMIANPVKGLNLIGGYAYNDIYTINTDPDVDGLRQWTGPGQTANLWISYHFFHTFLKGLTLGCGGNYNGKAYIGQSRSTGSFFIPEYTVLNTVASYDRSFYQVTLKVENFTNEIYWGSYVGQMMPRRVTASFAVRF